MKMEKRNLTCIGCPMGCALLVEMNGKEIISVTGNTCKKGAEYAVKEVTDPTRIVTTTVRVKNGSTQRLLALHGPGVHLPHGHAAGSDDRMGQVAPGCLP